MSPFAAVQSIGNGTQQTELSRQRVLGTDWPRCNEQAASGSSVADIGRLQQRRTCTLQRLHPGSFRSWSATTVATKAVMQYAVRDTADVRAAIKNDDSPRTPYSGITSFVHGVGGSQSTAAR